MLLSRNLYQRFLLICCTMSSNAVAGDQIGRKWLGAGNQGCRRGKTFVRSGRPGTGGVPDLAPKVSGWVHVATFGCSSVLTSAAYGTPGSSCFKLSDSDINKKMAANEIKIDFGSGKPSLYAQLVYADGKPRVFTIKSHVARWRFSETSSWLGPCGHPSQNTNYYLFHIKASSRNGPCQNGNYENAVYSDGFKNRDGSNFFPATGFSSNFKMYVKT